MPDARTRDGCRISLVHPVPQATGKSAVTVSKSLTKPHDLATKGDSDHYEVENGSVSDSGGIMFLRLISFPFQGAASRKFPLIRIMYSDRYRYF